MYGAVAWCKTAPNQTSRLMAKGANINDNPKAASTQESIAFHFDFADATDPAEHERLLMEKLCRTQSALAGDDWFSRGGQGHRIGRLPRRRR